MVIRFRSWDFLKTPHWDAGADLQQVPLATLLAICRHMGATLPENLAAQGAVSGSVTYNEQQGMQGRVVLRDASLSVPEETPVEAPVATVDIAGRSMSLERASVHIGEKQSAEIEGSYDLDRPRSLDLKITTRGLSVAAMRSFGLEAIPLLEQTPQGNLARLGSLPRWRLVRRVRAAKRPDRAGWAGRASADPVGVGEPERKASGRESFAGESGRDRVYGQLSLGTWFRTARQIRFEDRRGRRRRNWPACSRPRCFATAAFWRERSGWERMLRCPRGSKRFEPKALSPSVR